MRLPLDTRVVLNPAEPSAAMLSTLFNDAQTRSGEDDHHAILNFDEGDLKHGNWGVYKNDEGRPEEGQALTIVAFDKNNEPVGFASIHLRITHER